MLQIESGDCHKQLFLVHFCLKQKDYQFRIDKRELPYRLVRLQQRAIRQLKHPCDCSSCICITKSLYLSAPCSHLPVLFIPTETSFHDSCNEVFKSCKFCMKNIPSFYLTYTAKQSALALPIGKIAKKCIFEFYILGKFVSKCHVFLSE